MKYSIATDAFIHEYCIMFTDDEMWTLSEHGLKIDDPLFEWLCERTISPTWSLFFKEHDYPLYVKFKDGDTIRDFMIEFKLRWM